MSSLLILLMTILAFTLAISHRDLRQTPISICTNYTLGSCVAQSNCFWCLDDNTCRIAQDPYCNDHLTFPTSSCNARTYEILFIVFLVITVLIIIGACVCFCWSMDQFKLHF